MLVVHNLSLQKNHTRILSAISFELHPNQITAVVGPSGSGKTSLLRCIAGLERYHGIIKLDNQLLNSLPPEQRQVGFVEQDATLFPHLSAYDNIAYPLKLRRTPHTELAQSVQTLVRQFYLQPLLGRYPHELSGGEQRRVMLARTLIYQPKLLLFDEPFASIDTLLRIELVKLLKISLQRRPVPTLYVSHDLAEADYISQQRLILKQGHLVDQTDPWVKEFLSQRFT